MGLIIRALARLMALGALFGSWVLLLICCLSVPTRNYNFSSTTFDNGGTLQLGMFGSCYRLNTTSQCSATSVGYHLNVTNLPRYTANPGALVNITEKPLTSALIFYPLAVGSTSLANLLTLVPIRIVTFMAIGLTFLSVGATGISFVISLITFTRANALLKVSFNPTTFVHPVLGNCLWFTAAALLCTVGAFLFLIIALEPAAASKRDESVLTTSVYGANYGGNSSDKYMREIEREKSRSGNTRAAVAGRNDRHIDSERMSIDSRGNRRAEDFRHYGRRGGDGSVRTARARRPRDEEEDLYSEEEVRRPARAHRAGSVGRSSRNSRRRSSRYEETESETETEDEPPRRKKSVRSHRTASERSHKSRSNSDEADGYVDFAGRRL